MDQSSFDYGKEQDKFLSPQNAQMKSGANPISDYMNAGSSSPEA